MQTDFIASLSKRTNEASPLRKKKIQRHVIRLTERCVTVVRMATVHPNYSQEQLFTGETELTRALQWQEKKVGKHLKKNILRLKDVDFPQNSVQCK